MVAPNTTVFLGKITVFSKAVVEGRGIFNHPAWPEAPAPWGAVIGAAQGPKTEKPRHGGEEGAKIQSGAGKRPRNPLRPHELSPRLHSPAARRTAQPCSEMRASEKHRNPKAAAHCPGCHQKLITAHGAQAPWGRPILKTPSRGCPGASTSSSHATSPPRAQRGAAPSPQRCAKSSPTPRGHEKPHTGQPSPSAALGLSLSGRFLLSPLTKASRRGQRGHATGGSPVWDRSRGPAGPSLTGGSTGGEQLRWGRVSAAVWQEEEAERRGRVARRSSRRGPAGAASVLGRALRPGPAAPGASRGPKLPQQGLRTPPLTGGGQERRARAEPRGADPRGTARVPAASRPLGAQRWQPRTGTAHPGVGPARGRPRQGPNEPLPTSPELLPTSTGPGPAGSCRGWQLK